MIVILSRWSVLSATLPTVGWRSRASICSWGLAEDCCAASVNTACEDYRIREDVTGGLWVTANLGTGHAVAQMGIGQGNWSQPVTYASGEVRAADSDFLIDERGLSLPLADGRVLGFRLDDLNSNVSERCF